MSGIQGFPSNQKVPLGTGITNNFATVIPVDPNRSAIDIPRFAFRVDDALVARTAGATTGIDSSTGEKLFWVNDPSTPARVGDFVRFEDGAAAFLEIPIVKVETNRFLLSVNSGALPAANDTFFIMRYTTQRVDSTGSQVVISSPGPSQFVLNGVDVEVERDTVTPGNSVPFPVINLNNSGNPVDFATEATLGLVEIHTEAAAIILGEAASGVTPFKVQQVVPTNGFYDEITNLTTTPQTFTAPANAVGFVIEALSDNNQNIRYKIGAAASATSGMRLEPGRSENFNHGPAANVSVCAESGSGQVVAIQWILRV